MVVVVVVVVVVAIAVFVATVVATVVAVVIAVAVVVAVAVMSSDTGCIGATGQGRTVGGIGLHESESYMHRVQGRP